MKRAPRPPAIPAAALMREAALARSLAHAPYSRFPVGAALLTRSGRAKVADFGLAKRVEGEPGPGDAGPTDNAATVSDLSRAGAVAGTVSYMSPEQTRGDTLDPRSDLFSLGVVLYEALTGRLPFEGPTAIAGAILLLASFGYAKFTAKEPRGADPTAPPRP